MGTDGGTPTSGAHTSRASPSLSDMPPLSQCLPLEPISLGSQEYTRSGELRRALGFPLGSASEDHSHRASNFRPSPPVATEELKQFKNSVLDSSIKARERSKMFRESIYKIDKYREAVGPKKRQRSDLLSNEKSSGSNSSKNSGQFPRNALDHPAQKSEDRAKCIGLNKRVRSSGSEARVNAKSGSLSKDHMNNDKDSENVKPAAGVSVQPEERIRRLSAMGESWDKKMKRKRSAGSVANRALDGDTKRILHSKTGSDSKSASNDTGSRSNTSQGISTGNRSVMIKGKISKAPRSGTVVVVNSSDIQASPEASGGWEQSGSMTKSSSFSATPNPQRPTNAIGQWVGQRPQKIQRTRRTNVVSPIPSHDEAPSPSLSFAASGLGSRNPSSGDSGSLASGNANNNIPVPKTKAKPENFTSDVEETRGSELKMEEQGLHCGDMASNGKGKVRAFVVPTKGNQTPLDDNVGDGGRKQGRTGRGLSLSRPGVPKNEGNLENVCTSKLANNMRHGAEKIKSKSGRPPSRKLSDGKAFARAAESQDDREELLAAAASTRKSSQLACSGKFWKKMEPIFGAVCTEDACSLKQQLNIAEELEESLAQMSQAEYNILGAFTHKEMADVSHEKQGGRSNQLLDKDEAVSEGLAAGRRLGKFSSLYQRVLSALIEEDENEGNYNGAEGISLSFQCASDDSHCGSCNYTNVDTRDKERFESEAESYVDIQIQRRCVGDRFSCNKSITSNTTRNLSMSDSLYSSGRWLGDDGFSHSDVEFVSGICQNDLSGMQPTDVNTSGTPLSDCHYQQMCVDDKLVLELQSIGLYIDTLPDLAEGEEVINQDLMELREGLSHQIGKKKINLLKIDEAVQADKDTHKCFIEQVAMEQLIQMAYKRRMACRRNNASKTVMRKVSKQVAVGFMERTLARCRNFEITGQNCFSEPALQAALFAPPPGNDTSVGAETEINRIHEAPKCQIDTARSGFGSGTHPRLDPCTNGIARVSTESPCTFPHSFGHGRVLGGSFTGGTKGKRTDRDKDHGRGMFSQQSSGNFRNEQKQKVKSKQSTTAILRPSSGSIQPAITGSNRSSTETGLPDSENLTKDAPNEIEDPIDFADFPLPEFESIEQLGGPTDFGGAQDFSSLLDFDEDGLQDHDEDGFQDYDCKGLDIPMDDLSQLNIPL